VAALIKRVANPRAAAKVLCDAAKKARLYGGHSADDISAIVINLDAETSRSKK
jgi:serine/threonine protein phosphatase PrpC